MTDFEGPSGPDAIPDAAPDSTEDLGTLEADLNDSQDRLSGEGEQLAMLTKNPKAQNVYKELVERSTIPATEQAALVKNVDQATVLEFQAAGLKASRDLDDLMSDVDPARATEVSGDIAFNEKYRVLVAKKSLSNLKLKTPDGGTFEGEIGEDGGKPTLTGTYKGETMDIELGLEAGKLSAMVKSKLGPGTLVASLSLAEEKGSGMVKYEIPW
jgi:polyhydroxyalkanoate synthesis regulator phasin